MHLIWERLRNMVLYNYQINNDNANNSQKCKANFFMLANAMVQQIGNNSKLNNNRYRKIMIMEKIIFYNCHGNEN